MTQRKRIEAARKGAATRRRGDEGERLALAVRTACEQHMPTEKPYAALGLAFGLAVFNESPEHQMEVLSAFLWALNLPKEKGHGR